MTRNKNDDDASGMKRIKTYEISGVASPWSDLHHDVLLLIMMQLGVSDFLAFLGVCKSWKSVALSNRNKFLATRAPMVIHISNDNKCTLTDFDKKQITPTLLHSTGRVCLGLTCGYMILYSENTRDIWLVNPVKRHQIYFPNIPFNKSFVLRRKNFLQKFRAILVFLPTRHELVLVVFIENRDDKIWFCRAGQREWTSVPTSFRILGLQAFKGKLYALHSSNTLSEVILYPTPKVTFLEIDNFEKPDFDHPVLVSSGENLCVMDAFSKNAYKIINLSKVEGVSMEKINNEFPLFISKSMDGGFVISDLGLQYKRFAVTVKGPKRKTFNADMWYFFKDCLKIKILQDW